MCSGYSDSSLEPPTFINWAATRRGMGTLQDPQSFKKFLQKTFQGKIFSNLNTIDHLRVEKICRHWRQIAISYSWDNYEMISYSQVFQDCPAAKVTMCMKVTNRHVNFFNFLEFKALASYQSFG